MKQKSDTLEKIFKDNSFRIIGSYFLKEPRTAMSVAKESGVSRQTIIKELNKVNDYIEQPNWSGTVKGRPLELKLKILTDYLSIKLKLEAKEKGVLEKIIFDKSIAPVIKKNNENLETAMNKIILTVLLIGVIRYNLNEEKKPSLIFVDSLFGDLIRSKTLKSISEKKVGKVKLKNTKIEHFSFEYSNLIENEEEFKNYENTIKGYAKQTNSFELDDFDGLLRDLRFSNFQISTTPNIWYDIFGFTINPNLYYTEYTQNRYQKDSKKSLKHGSPDAEKLIENIEKQLKKGAKQ
jgi:hypothetical protein